MWQRCIVQPRSHSHRHTCRLCILPPNAINHPIHCIIVCEKCSNLLVAIHRSSIRSLSKKIVKNISIDWILLSRIHFDSICNEWTSKENRNTSIALNEMRQLFVVCRIFITVLFAIENNNNVWNFSNMIWLGLMEHCFEFNIHFGNIFEISQNFYGIDVHFDKMILSN